MQLDDENAMSMERSTLMHLAKKVDRVDETESPRLRLSVQQSKTDLFRMPTNTTFHDGETVESVYLDVGGSGVKWAFRTSENRIVQPFTTEKRDAPLDDTADIPLKKKMTRASVDGAVWDWSGGTVETPVGDLEYNAKLLEKLIPQTYDKVVRYARSVSRVGNGKRLPLIVTQAGDICGGRGHGRLKNGKSMDESHDFGASWTDEVPLTEVYKTISETLPDDVPMTVINDGFSHYLGFAELAKRTGEAIDFPALTMTFGSGLASVVTSTDGRIRTTPWKQGPDEWGIPRENQGYVYAKENGFHQKVGASTFLKPLINIKNTLEKQDITSERLLDLLRKFDEQVNYDEMIKDMRKLDDDLQKDIRKIERFFDSVQDYINHMVHEYKKLDDTSFKTLIFEGGAVGIDSTLFNSLFRMWEVKNDRAAFEGKIVLVDYDTAMTGNFFMEDSYESANGNSDNVVNALTVAI
ncbi:hypothetical protein CYMTET_2999 [Cymbomonas tetramitiformis]|uniref:Uncharacterized protein n=1 Tax=Cymbomonas tetramitiformis TaxID=36881 RepID=A0AAE0LLI5_9CHLO|nr:hypothetical protein CYMTET_2999 [Cymbomonas tetramitiformis]